VVEIYPRLLTGPVIKSRREARLTYLERFPDLSPDHRATAASCEDAFDAAVSALVMAANLNPDLLPVVSDVEMRQEGVIWHPNLDLKSLATPAGEDA
jgi:hypothetical protein